MSDTPSSRNLASIALLQSQLTEKIRMISTREREVHSLGRSLAAAQEWMNSMTAIAIELHSLADSRAAVEQLIWEIPPRLRFDAIVVSWGDLLLHDGDLELFGGLPGVHNLLVAFDAIDARPPALELTSRAPAGGWAAGLRLVTTYPACAPIYVLLGRSSRTLAYYPDEAHDIMGRLERSAARLGASFDAVLTREDLVRQRDELQETVRDATRELRAALLSAEDAALRAEEAHRIAESSARARGEFLANMSHEIRTPLTAVLGYTELLQRGTMSEDERARSLRTIEQSGRHLLQLLDDVLDLARIESGRFKIDRQAFSVPQMLMDVCSLLRVRATAKNVDLVLRFDTDLPSQIITDGGRLRQILVNLIGNAVKFTAEGSVTVAASYRVERTPPELSVDVIDTGIGIPADKLESVFLSFEQASSGTSRSFGGSGLGLAICRNLAQMLGGTVTASSVDGRGSRFVVQIAAPLALNTAWVAQPDERDPIESPANLRKLSGRVLIIDDTPVNRDLFRAFLQSFGATVEDAADGMLGVAAVHKAVQDGKPYNLILMDMQMPTLDGYGAARQLRAEGVRTPIVAVTANAMAGDRKKCIAAGCTDYLAKPVRGNSLYAMASRFLRPRVGVAPLHSVSRTDLVLADLMGTFLADVNQSTQKLQEAIAAEDLRVVADLAHRIKGASATFGFPSIASIAGQIEGLGRRMEVDGIAALGQELAQEVARVKPPQAPPSAPSV
jgi:signal transduction histidine kinase/DNA-binding response OmpR family regulator